MDFDSLSNDESPLGQILHEVITWVAEEDRELMVKALAGQFGEGAGEFVTQLYQIHKINNTEG